jgi:hypothetical protein
MAPAPTQASLRLDDRISHRRRAIPSKTTKEELTTKSKITPEMKPAEFVEEKKKSEKTKKYAPVFSKSNKHTSFPSLQLSYSHFSLC